MEEGGTFSKCAGLLVLLAEGLGFRKSKIEAELYNASKNGDTETIMGKLNGSPFNYLQKTPGGDTILHIAARYGCEEVVSNLLCVVRKCVNGFRLASLSLVYFGSTNVLRARNANGNTPLHEAAKGGHARIIEKILREDKRMASVSNNIGETPLFLACWSPESVRALLKCGGSALVTHMRKDKKTCLHVAALQENLETMEILVEDRDEALKVLKVRDSFGATALHSAVQRGSLEIVEYLLQKTPNLVYVEDNFGRAPVHLAVIRGEIKILEAMANKAPDCIDMRSKDGKTVLHFAVQSNQSKVVEWIIKKHPSQFSGDESDNHGNLPIHLAVIHGVDEEIVKTLLETFPRVNIMTVNKQGFTCLDIVCVTGRSYEGIEQVKTRLRKEGAFSIDDSNEDDVLNSPEERKGHFGRMISTNAVVAALLATLAFTVPTESIVKDADNFHAYMISSSISFYASMTVMLVWILLEPLSRTVESSWLKSSMYVLGIAVVSTAAAFYIYMNNIVDHEVKHSEQHPEEKIADRLILATVIVPSITLLVILFKMCKEYAESKELRKEYVRRVIEPSAIRLYLVILLLSVFVNPYFLLAAAGVGITVMLSKGVVHHDTIMLRKSIIALVIAGIGICFVLTE